MLDKFGQCGVEGLAGAVVDGCDACVVACDVEAGSEFADVVIGLPPVEQAEEFVAWTRYPPEGRRGAMFGGAHDDYAGATGAATVPEIISGAESRTMVCVLIESAKGLANAEEIMSVDGVDVAHLGHGDLSLSLEVPGQTGHPTMQAGIDRILAACEQHGKAAACLAGDVATGRDWVRRGFRMVSYSYDIGLLGAALRSGIDQIQGAGTEDAT